MRRSMPSHHVCTTSSFTERSAGDEGGRGGGGGGGGEGGAEPRRRAGRGVRGRWPLVACGALRAVGSRGVWFSPRGSPLVVVSTPFRLVSARLRFVSTRFRRPC